MSEATKTLCVACPVLRERDLCQADCEKHDDQKDCVRPRRPPLGVLVCLGCQRQVERELRELVEPPAGLEQVAPTGLWAAAYANLLPGRSAESGRVSPVFESRLPGSTEVLSLSGPGTLPEHLTRQGVASVDLQVGVIPAHLSLSRWVDDWRKVRGMRETGPALHLPPIVRWLLDRLDWAFENYPRLAGFVGDVHKQHRHLRAVAGLSELVHLLSPPCPSCGAMNDRDTGQRGLHRQDGAEYVECGTCARLWSLPEWDWLVSVLAAEQRLKAKMAKAESEAT